MTTFLTVLAIFASFTLSLAAPAASQEPNPYDTIEDLDDNLPPIVHDPIPSVCTDGYCAAGDYYTTWMECDGGYYANLSAYRYLNMTASNTSDVGYCPVDGMFDTRHPYWPVFGWEANVANDYGWVAIRNDGQCSWMSDTGPEYDFQVPCKAHDYAYDLRRAGFSGTVSDYHADRAFKLLMYAHCDDRELTEEECKAVADEAHWGARQVQADPSPGEVVISSRASGLCLDVDDASTTSGAEIIQWGCYSTANQRWTITPVSDDPGTFRLVASHSGMCADAYLEGITQWSCIYDEQPVRIWDVRAADMYTIRPVFLNNSECYDVPGSSTTWGEQIIRWDCHVEDNQIWYINPAW